MILVKQPIKDNNSLAKDEPEEPSLTTDYLHLLTNPKRYPTGKPAKKYISDPQMRITERDSRLPVRSIPSNWQATELTELDVPNILLTAAKNRWPSHWPGNHSPMIMQAIMQTGEVMASKCLTREPKT